MNLIKNVATVGGWTLAYRVSSLVRDIAQSCILGAGVFSDLFNLAFKFANVLRKLFAEGAFNASFLPIFSRTLQDKGKKEAEKIASQILTWLVFVISFLMIICLIFFRSVIHLYAPGIDQSSETFEHLVYIGRVCSPYIGISFLVAMFGGILNTVNRFAMPAGVQIILNLGVIAGLFIGALWFPSAAYTMAWGTFFGGLLQLMILWINVRVCGFRIGFDLSSVKEEVTQFFRKLVSGAVGSGVWQLNVVVDFILLSLLPTGAVSYFYYTDHVNQFPIGILGIAFSTALLPPLTRAIHDKDNVSAEKQMNLGLLFAFIFTLPAAVILMTLNEPVTGAIYGRGNFGPEQVAAAAPALAAFAFGLPAYMATKVFTTAFFANKDVRTPRDGVIISIVTNFVFSAIFMPMLKHTGIALATTLSAWCNVIYLLISLPKLGSIGITANTVKECLKQVIMSLLMFIAIFVINEFYENPHYANGGADRNTVLVSVIAVGVVVFYLSGKALSAFDFMDDIKNMDEK